MDNWYPILWRIVSTIWVNKALFSCEVFGEVATSGSVLSRFEPEYNAFSFSSMWTLESEGRIKWQVEVLLWLNGLYWPFMSIMYLWMKNNELDIPQVKKKVFIIIIIIMQGLF